MRKITSTDISNAIDFAKAQPEVIKELARRDGDNQLDCVRIVCGVTSAIDAREKEFEISFNYEDIDRQPRNGEDIRVIVLYRDGVPVDWAWKNR